MRTSIQYTLLRLLIFFACLLLLWLIPPLRDNVLLLLILATTVSMLISVFALNEMRNRMSREITQKIDERHFRKQERHDHGFDDHTVEDEEDENVTGGPRETYR